MTLESEVARADSDFQQILHGDLPQFDQALERANLTPLAGGAGTR